MRLITLLNSVGEALAPGYVVLATLREQENERRGVSAVVESLMRSAWLHAQYELARLDAKRG